MLRRRAWLKDYGSQFFDGLRFVAVSRRKAKIQYEISASFEDVVLFGILCLPKTVAKRLAKMNELDDGLCCNGPGGLPGRPPELAVECRLRYRFSGAQSHGWCENKEWCFFSFCSVQLTYEHFQ